jgi:hypothetical protein
MQDLISFHLRGGGVDFERRRLEAVVRVAR